jgi:hypothetical protein
VRKKINKSHKLPVQLIEDELWDHYSGLPNPMWYQHIAETDEEENTNNSNDTSVTTE